MSEEFGTREMYDKLREKLMQQPTMMNRNELKKRNWARQKIAAMICDPTLAADFAYLRTDFILFYGPGTDLGLLFYTMNLTDDDRKLLEGMKITAR